MFRTALTLALGLAITQSTSAQNKFNMDITAAGIRPGSLVLGPAVSTDDFEGRVVLVEFWGVECPPCLRSMPYLARLNGELGEFGLVMIGLHVQQATPGEIAAKAREFGANFAIFDGGTVTDGRDFSGIPHTMVFGHDGTCVYRGHPMESGAAVRKAVGESLVARAGAVELSPQVRPLAEALKEGKSPTEIRPRLQRLGVGTGAGAEMARRLLVAMSEAAPVPADEDLLETYERLKASATHYRGTPAGDAAAVRLKEITGDPASVREVYALQSLRTVKELDAAMRQQAGDADPNTPQFRRTFGLPLRKMRQTLTTMGQKFPDEKATAEAREIADRYGLND